MFSLFVKKYCKNINGCKLLIQVQIGGIYARYYPGSKIRHMEDQAKPTSRTEKDRKILQVGENNLPTWKNPDEIAKSIVQLGSALKTKSYDLSISSITPRNNQYHQKTIKVNKELTNLF